MADINPAIPMGMNYGTSAFIQSADIRKSLAAADSVNLETAIKLEAKQKYNTAQNIIKRHLKKDGTLDPIGATKELYAFSPEHADMFVKEHAAHLDNVLKGMVTQGHTEDYPKARAFLETQRGGQQQPVAPAAPAQPVAPQAQPEPEPVDPALAQEQQITANMAASPQEAALNQQNEQNATLAQMLGSPASQQFAMGGVPSNVPVPTENKTVGQMAGVVPPQAQPQAPAQGYVEKYLQYALDPQREQYAHIEPMLEAEQGATAAALVKASKDYRTPAESFEPGGEAFEAIRKSILAGIPMSKILSNFNRLDKTSGLATYLGADMYKATGIDVAKNVNPADFRYAFGQSEARVGGALTPANIGAAAEKQARGGSGRVLNSQVMAGERLLALLRKSKDAKTNKYMNLSDPFMQDVSSDYMRLLMQSGQIAESQVKRAQQLTAKGEGLKAVNFVLGTSYTTGDPKFLALLETRANYLTEDLRRQFAKQVDRGEYDPMEPTSIEDEETPTVRTAADYEKLEPGQLYLTPDGKKKVKGKR